MKIEIDINDIVLFGPRSGKSLMRTYRELAENPKFKGIPDNELLFAWYMGIPNSPVDTNLPSMTRYKSAALRCFPENKEKRERFSDGDVSDEVKAAILEFGKFSPEARLIANSINQVAIKNFLKMVHADDKDFYTYKDIKNKNGEIESVKEVDYQAKKQYADTVATITKILPDLLKQSEDGFGISDDKKTEEALGKKPIDLYHQTKKDKTH